MQILFNRTKLKINENHYSKLWINFTSNSIHEIMHLMIKLGLTLLRLFNYELFKK